MTVAERARAVAGLRRTLEDGPGTGDAQDPGPSPRRARAEMMAAWRRLVAAQTARGSLALIVDDLHWAGSGLLGLFGDLVAAAAGPLLVLGFTRPESDLPRDPFGVSTTWMGLAPLDASASGRLLDGLLGSQRASHARRAVLVRRAAGNPLFLEEMARALRDRRAADDRTRSPDDVLPDTVQAVLAARIDRLPPAARRVLRAAALSGEPTWPGLIASLLGVARAEILAPVDQLVRTAYLEARPTSSVEGEPELGFRHPLIGEVAYEGATRRERAEGHLRAAQWLEGLGEAAAARHLDRSAHHLAAASSAGAASGAFGDGLEAIRARALAAAMAAGAVALRRIDPDAARRHGEDALGLAADDLDRSAALESLGEAALAAYQGDRAWSLLKEAALLRERVAPRDDTAIVRLVAAALSIPARWGAMDRLPDEPDARALLELGLDRSARVPTPERVRILSVAAAWPLAFPDARVGPADLGSAIRQGDRAVSLAAALDDPVLLAGALDARSVTAFARGRYREMRALSERRLALLDRLDDPREVEDAWAMAARGAFHEGRYRDAHALADSGVGAAFELSPRLALHSLEWRLLALAAMGDHEGVERDLALGLTVLPHSGEEGRPGFRRRPWAAAALLRRLAGDTAGARDALDRMTPVAAPTTASPTPEPDPAAPWTARLHALDGRWDRAWEQLWLPAAAHLQEDAGLLLEAACDVMAAWLERRGGRPGHEEPSTRGSRRPSLPLSGTPSPPDPVELLARARRQARAGGLRALSARADRLEAVLADAEGDRGRATGLARRAARRFADAGALADAAAVSAWARAGRP
jgi:hypothetical protein